MERALRKKYARQVGFTTLFAAALVTLAANKDAVIRLGKQPDGAFMVSSGQRIEPGTVAFDGRPGDIAVHPNGQVAAILGQKSVFLINRTGVLPDSAVPTVGDKSYHGIIWSADGTKCYASNENGKVLEMTLAGQRLEMGRTLTPAPDNATKSARPGGLAITKDGRTLFVACCDRNSVAEIDLVSGKFVREFPVQLLPYDVKLSQDETTLAVSNWGGRPVKEDDEKAETAGVLIVTDPRGAPASGTVSLISRSNGSVEHREVGLHPTALLIQGDDVIVANAASDTLTVLPMRRKIAPRTLPLKWGKMNLFGAMPNALAMSPNGKTLYVACGGDNAMAEMEYPSGKVKGYRPAGYFPSGVGLSPDGKTAFVVNTKGNGSVREILKGKAGNAHDYQGTVSILDLSADLKTATAKVAANNGWNRDAKALKPQLKVYNGAIKHVLYIIKENRTYDEVFGDLPQGNGDPKLAYLAPFLPNHRKIAQEFTLFDNGYVSGTNSADGHAWSNQALANDYLEKFYDGYRTYPDDGDCAMSIPSSGNLWDMAAKKGKTIRVYGEFCDDKLARFDPPVKDWLEVWKDRGIGRIKFQVNTTVKSLKPYIHPEVVYWPLLQSDQVRADLFIKEYNEFSKANRVPNLMILSLPCDHAEGRDPKYPKPQSMMADNDLALGRVVEAISKSPQWKETCIFVIEDDAQSGPDHVDGHRTVYMVISPYVRRKFVDSSLYTTVSMLRSIELMLGLDPMNRFDALSLPITACFTDTPDVTPYTVTPSTVALDDMNPPVEKQAGKELYWTKQSLALDWSGLDRVDYTVYNRVLWHSVKGVNVPYPTDGGRALLAQQSAKRHDQNER